MAFNDVPITQGAQTYPTKLSMLEEQLRRATAINQRFVEVAKHFGFPDDNAEDAATFMEHLTISEISFYVQNDSYIQATLRRLEEDKRHRP